MRNAISTLAAAALLAAFTPGALADQRVPAAVAQGSTPASRSADLASSSGSHFVWVQRIEGRNREGQTVLLFSNREGALLALRELPQADRLINPLRLKPQGEYTELQLQLADRMLTIDKRGMQQQPLPPGITPQMVLLRGKLTANRLEVSARSHTPPQQLALITP